MLPSALPLCQGGITPTPHNSSGKWCVASTASPCQQQEHSDGWMDGRARAFAKKTAEGQLSPPLSGKQIALLVSSGGQGQVREGSEVGDVLVCLYDWIQHNMNHHWIMENPSEDDDLTRSAYSHCVYMSLLQMWHTEHRQLEKWQRDVSKGTELRAWIWKAKGWIKKCQGRDWERLEEH